jgi:hypothetical protein
MKNYNVKSSLLIVVITFLMTSSMYSQEKIEKPIAEKYNHGVGFGAGISTGYGLSYRYFGKKLGAQVNFSPYKDRNNANVSSGVTFLYRLGTLDEFSFYVYQGNHLYYNKETLTNYDEISGKEISVDKIENFFNNGIGMGVEHITSERISLNGMIGYAGQENFEIISISVEVAVYFKF